MEHIRFLQGPVVFAMFLALWILETRIGHFGYDVVSRREHAAVNIPMTLLSMLILGIGSFLVVLACHVTTLYGVGVSYLFKKFTHPGIFVPIDILIFDLLNYWIHRSMHMFPFLWRLHRAHHTDVIIDVTSSFRFHPFENLYRVLGQFIFAFVWGLSASAMGIYAVLVGIALCFSHANIELRKTLEDRLSYFFVTPFYHRIHHSPVREEHDSNYGIGFMFWDYLFKTFRASSKENKIGISGYSKHQSFRDVLEDPFI